MLLKEFLVCTHVKLPTSLLLLLKLDCIYILKYKVIANIIFILWCVLFCFKIWQRKQNEICFFAYINNSFNQKKWTPTTSRNFKLEKLYLKKKKPTIKQTKNPRHYQIIFSKPIYIHTHTHICTYIYICMYVCICIHMAAWGCCDNLSRAIGIYSCWVRYNGMQPIDPAYPDQSTESSCPQTDECSCPA